MNKIFKVLWNKSRGCFVVSNEAQRIHGKEKSEKRLAISLGLASLLGLATLPSYADVTKTEITNASGWTNTSITTSGNLTKITTTKIQGDTANNKGIGINHFDKFNLKSGNIANLIVPNSANNLVNFVNNKVNIDGTVNSLKGSKVGGNLFFVTPNGMTIGATGVINAGSLTAVVPTQDAYKDWTGDISGQVTSALLNKMQSGAVPLNRAGVITVNGSINVGNRIVLAASKIEIGSTAQLSNKIAEEQFRSLVNIPDSTKTTEGIDGTLELKDTGDGSGDILLYARTDTKDDSSIEAKVNIAGSIASRENVAVVALAGNGSYKESTSQFVSDGIRDTGEIKATIAVSGSISSDKDVGILARADNQALKAGTIQKMGQLTAKVFGSISGINEDVAYGNLVTTSTVTVAEGAKINAGGDLSIRALADTRLEVGAAFAAVQTLQLLKEGAEKIPAVAAVVAKIDTESSVIINGSLTTGGDLTIASKDSLNGTASAVAAQSVTTDDNPGHIAFTYAKFEGDSSVNIGKTASITLNQKTGSTSGGDVSITSEHTSRVNTTAEATVEKAAYGAIAINYTEHNTSSAVTMNTGLTGVDANTLTIASNNTTERESMYAQTRSGAVDGLKAKFNHIVKGLSQGFASGLLDKATKAVNKNFEAKDLKLVGTAGVITGTQSSTVTINAPDKSLKTAGKISISSLSKKYDHHYTVFSESAGEKSKDGDQTGEVSVAGAIGLLVVLPDGSDTVTSDLTIADKVNIESTAGTVVINNKAEIGYNRIQAMIDDLLKKVDLLKDIFTYHTQKDDSYWTSVESSRKTLEDASKTEGAQPSVLLGYTKDLATNIKTAFSNAGAVFSSISTISAIVENACQFIQLDSYVNSYVTAAASADKDKTAFGGGLGVIQQSTASNLTIGKGVKIYAKPTVTTDTIAIDVASESVNEAVALSGHLKSMMGIALPTITDASSFGATILVQSQKTNNTLTIREGAELIDKSEAAFVRVTASDRVENITIGASADVSSGSFGISANVTTSLSEGTNLLRIDDEATLSGGNIKVEAKRRDNNQAIAVTASVGSGDEPSNNVGASVAINIIDLKNNVAIEDNDILDKDKDKNLYTTTGLMSAKRLATRNGTGVEISAHQDTTLNAIGASGGVAMSGSSEGGVFSKIKDWFSNIGDAVKEKFSGIGDLIDTVDENAESWGNTAGKFVGKVKNIFSSNKEGNSNLDNPENQQDIAGNENNNPGNDLFDEDGNANLDDGIDDPILDDDMDKHFQMGLAASIAWNVIDLENKVTIKTDNFKIQTEKLNVEAATDKWIGAWAGGVAASLVDLNDAKTSTTAGIGGAVAVNSGTLTNKIDISRAGTVTGATASILLDKTTEATILAVNNGRIIAEGLSAGVARSKSAEGGSQNSFDVSASINILENTVRADVSSVEQTTDDYAIAWDQAAWNGETQVTGGTGFGLSLQSGQDASRSLGFLVAYGEIENTVASTATSLTLRSARNFDVRALTNVSQVTTSVGANVTTGDSSFAFTGAAAATDFVNTVNAEVSNSAITLTSDGVTQIIASGITDDDSSEFKTLSNWVEESGIAKKANLDKELSNQDFYSEVTLQKKKDEAKTDGQQLSELGTKTGLLQTTVVVSAAVSTNDTSSGAAVLVNQINNTFTTNVTSSQFNQLSGASTAKSSYTQRAEANATSVGVATGIAASPSSSDNDRHYAVAGSVIVSNVDQTSTSTVTDSTVKTHTVAIESANKATTVNVAGEVGVSLSEKGSGLGAAVTVMNTDNRAEVSITGNSVINASKLTVNALNNARAWDVAADVAVSKAVSFAGSVAVNRVKNESVITVNGLTLKDLTASSFLSDDKSNLWTLAGAVAYSGGDKAGVSGAVAYSISGRGSSDGTKVDINDLTVQKTTGNPSGNLTVKAEATDKVHSLVIAAGVGTDAKVGFAGAAGVGEVKRETTATVKNLKTQMLNTDGSVIESNTSAVLGALSIKAIETSGIYNLGLAASFADKVSLGLGIAVNRITTTTNASLTDDSASENRIKTETLEVSAKTADDIENIAIGGAGSKDTFALMGSVAVNKLTDNTKAELNKAKVDLVGGAASVNAQSDDVIGSYVGQVSGAKTAAGGLSVLVNTRYGTTEANVTNSEVKQTATPTITTLKAKGTVDADKINDKIVNDISIAASLEKDRSETTIEGIRVGATSTTTLKSFVINGAGAGEAAGTGGATVNYHGGATKTTVTNSKLEAVKDLILESGDYVNIDNVLTIGAFAGKGAGTIAANVATTEHETTTTVSGGSLASSAGAVKTTSDAKEGVSSLAIGLAGAQYGAGAVLVNVTRELSDVKTELSKTATTTVTGKTVEAKSDYLGRLNSLAIMADGAQYGAGVINVIVNYNDNTVATNLGASKIKATDSVTVTSLRRTENFGIGVQVSGAMYGALAATIVVNTVEGSSNVTTGGAAIEGTETTANGNTTKATPAITLSSAGEDVFHLVDVSVTGALYGSAGTLVVVNRFLGTALTNVETSKISGGTVTIEAKQNRDIFANNTFVCGSIGTLGANVLATVIGGSADPFATATTKLTDLEKTVQDYSNSYAGSSTEDKPGIFATVIDGVGKNLTAEEKREMIQVAAKSAATAPTTTEGTQVRVNGSTVKGSTVTIAAKEDTESGAGTTLKTGEYSVAGAVAAASVGTLRVNRNLKTTVSASTVTATSKVTIATEIAGQSTLHSYQGKVSGIAGSAAYTDVDIQGGSSVLIDTAKISVDGNGEIAITAEDKSKTEAYSLGIDVSLVSGAGVIANTYDSSSVGIEIKNASSTRKVDDIAGKTKVFADRATERKSEVRAGTGGALNLTWSNALVTDSGNTSVTITGIKTSGSLFDARALNEAYLYTKSYQGYCSVLNVGVLHPETKASGKTTLTATSNTFASDAVTLDASTGALSFDSEGNKKTDDALRLTSIIESYGSSVAVGAVDNWATIENTTETNLTVTGNTYKTTINAENKEKYTTLNLGSYGYAVYEITSDLGTGGVIAEGAATANLIHNAKVTANVGATDAKLDSFTLNVDNIEKATLKAYSAGGSVIDISAEAAYVKHTDTSSVATSVSGTWNVTGDVEISSAAEYDLDFLADNTEGCVLGGSSAKIDNSLNGANTLTIAGTWTALGDFYASSLTSLDLGAADNKTYAVDTAVYGVIEGANGTINNTLKRDTIVNVAKNASITATNDLDISSQTKENSSLRARARTAGVAAGVTAYNDNTIVENTRVNLEEGTELRNLNADKEVTISASTAATRTIDAIGEIQGAVVSGAGAISINSITQTNEIETAQKSKITGAGKVNLYAGRDISGEEEDFNFTVYTHAYAKSLIGGTNSKLEDTFALTNRLTLNGDVLAVRSIDAVADIGSWDLSETSRYWELFSDKDAGNIRIASSAAGTKLSNFNPINSIVLNGKLTAGTQTKFAITIKGVVDSSQSNYTIEGAVAAPIVESEEGTVLDPDTVTTGTENISNYYVNRYNTLVALIEDYGASDSGSTAVVAYSKELELLKNKMVEQNLATFGTTPTKDGKVIPHASVVQSENRGYVSVSDITVAGGDVNLTADSLTGAGSITANVADKISIDNQTNLALKVENVRILEKGGNLTLNGVALSSKPTGFTGSLTSASNSSDPSMTITSKYLGKGGKVTLSYKDASGETITKTITPDNSITVNGVVANDAGDLTIEAVGDLFVTGTRLSAAGSMSLSATRSVMQSYTSGMKNIAGDGIDKLWQNEVDKFEKNNTQDRAGTEVRVPEGEGIIAGSDIFISADNINLNGLVQSGYATWTVNLTTEELETKVNQLKAKWKNDGSKADVNPISNDYLISAGGHYKKADGTYAMAVAVWFDPVNDRIIVDDINPEGGHIYLTGRIASTGGGKLYAASSRADVNINSGPYSVRLGEITTSNGKGLIEITDTTDPGNEPSNTGSKAVAKVYSWENDGSRLHYTVDTLFKDGKTSRSVNEYVMNGSEDEDLYLTFKPTEDLAYVWSKGYSWGKYYEASTSQDFTWWGLWESGDPSEWNNVTPRSVPNDNLSSGVTLATDWYTGNDYKFNASSLTKDQSEGQWKKTTWTTYNNWTHWSGTYHATAVKRDTGTTIYTYSVKADEAVDVKFLRGENSVTVISGEDIVLSGKVNAPSGTVNLTAERNIINESSNAAILGASNVNLVAIGDIGEAESAIRITNTSGKLNLSAKTTGFIYIDAAKSNAAVTVNASLLRASDVNLTTNGDVDIANLTAYEANIVSKAGNIKVSDLNQMPSTYGDDITRRFDATAAGSVDLSSTKDIGIGKIKAGTSVTVTSTNGNVWDALMREDLDNRNAEEKIALWKEAGILASDGTNNGLARWEDDVKAQKDIVKNDFERYQEYEALDATRLENLTESQTKDYNALKTRFAGITTADDAVDAEEAKPESNLAKTIAAKDNYGWSQDELLYAVSKAIVNPDSSTVPEAGDTNIEAKTITIKAKKSAGTELDKQTIQFSDINSEAYKVLARADVDDVKWGSDSVEVTLKRPISIKLTGENEESYLSGEAGTGFYVASDEKLRVDYINAPEATVRLTSAKGIDALYDEITTAQNIYAKNITLRAGEGSVGASDKPIYINSSNAVALSGKTGIYVVEVGDELKLVSASTEGDLDLTADKITQVTLEGQGAEGYLTAKKILLKGSDGADSDIGTKDQALKVKVLDNGTTSVVINSSSFGIFNLEILGDANYTLTLNENKLEADELLSLKSEGNLTIADSTTFETSGTLKLESGKTLTIKDSATLQADDIELTATGGDVVANKATFKPVVDSSENTNISITASQNVSLKDAKFEDETVTLSVLATEGSVNLTRSTLKDPLQVKELSVKAGGDVDVKRTEITSSTELKLDAEGDISAQASKLQSGTSLILEAKNLEASGATLKSENDSVTINTSKDASLRGTSISAANGTVGITSTDGYVNLSSSSVKSSVKAKGIDVNAKNYLYANGTELDSTGTLVLSSEGNVLLSQATLNSSSTDTTTPSLKLASSNGAISGEGAAITSNGATEITAKSILNLKNAAIASESGTLTITSTSSSVNLSTDNVAKEIKAKKLLVNAAQNVDLTGRVASASETMTVNATWEIIGTSSNLTSEDALTLSGALGIDVDSATLKSKTAALTLTSTAGSISATSAKFNATKGNVALTAKTNANLKDATFVSPDGALTIKTFTGNVDLSTTSVANPISVKSFEVDSGGDATFGTRSVTTSNALAVKAKSDIKGTGSFSSGTTANFEAQGSVHLNQASVTSKDALTVLSQNGSIEAESSTFQSTNGSVSVSSKQNLNLKNTAITAANGTAKLTSTEGYINLSASTGHSSTVKAQTIDIDAKSYIQALAAELESTGTLTVNSEGNVYALNTVLTAFSTATDTPALKLTSSSGSVNAGGATITSKGATEITSNSVLNLLNATIASESGTLVITSTSSMVNLASDDATKEIKAKTLLINAGQHIDLTDRVATASDSMTLTAAGLITGISSSLTSKNDLTLSGALGIDVGSATLKSQDGSLSLTSKASSISATRATLESSGEMKVTASSDVNLANATLTSTRASVSVTTTEGALTATGAAFNATNGNVTLVSESDANLTDASFDTPNGALLVKTDTGDVDLSTTSGGNRISVNTFEVNSGGDATFGTRSVTTKNALAIKAKNNLESSGTFSSGTTANFEAQGSVRLNQASVTSKDALTVLSQYGSIEAEGSTLQSTNGSVSVSSKQNLDLKNAAITAEAGSINVTSTAGAVNLAATDSSRAVKATNVVVAAASEVNLSSRSVQASEELKVTSQGTIVATSATLGSEDLITLQAKQGMTLNSANLVAHNTLTLTSEAGYITALNATLNAAGALDVEAKGHVNFTDSTLTSSNGTIEILSTRGDVTLAATDSSVDAIRAKNLTVKAAEEIDFQGRKAYLGDTAAGSTLPNGVLLFESEDSILADTTNIVASSITLTSNYGDILARNSTMVSAAENFTLAAGETIDVGNSALNASAKKLSFTSDFGEIKAENATLTSASEIALVANGDVSLSGSSVLTAPNVAITSEFALVDLSDNARIEAESIKLTAEAEDIFLADNVQLNATTKVTLSAGDGILQVDNSVIRAPKLSAEAEDSILLESNLGNQVPTVVLDSSSGDISFNTALETAFSINDATDGVVFGDLWLYVKDNALKLTDTIVAGGDISIHAKSFEAPALFAEGGVYVSTNFNNDEKGTSIKIAEGVLASEIGLMADKGSIDAGVLNAMDGSICLYRTSLTTEGTIKVEEFYATDNSFIYNANGNISPGLACEEEVHIAFGGKGVLDKASISPEASIYVMHAMGRLTDTINSMTKEMENDWRWFPMLGWNETAYSMVERSVHETAWVYRRETKEQGESAQSESELIHDYWTRGYPQQKIEGLLSFD